MTKIGELLPICRGLAAFVAGICATATAIAAPAPPQASQGLIDDDRRVLAISGRMLVGNAHRCAEKMPYIGIAMHSSDQYPDSAEEFLQNQFPDGRDLAVLAVADDSPAAAAQLEAGTVLSAIGEWTPTPGISAYGDQLRLAAFEQLALRPPAADVTLTTFDGRVNRAVSITPVPACRLLVELVPSSKRFARSDGKIVQVSSRLAGELSDDQLAVVLAHEIAHAVLKHREWLSGEQVKKGLLGEFGKSARLGREAEIEADRLSVHLLRDAGFDPAIAPAFWRSDEGKGLSGGLFRKRIYPSAKERAEVLATEMMQEDFVPQLRDQP